jgi:hypothetical protein
MPGSERRNLPGQAGRSEGARMMVKRETWHGIACPWCKSQNSQITDSRPYDQYIRRRRKCEGCGPRYTTFEMIGTETNFVKNGAVSFMPPTSLDPKPLQRLVAHLESTLLDAKAILATLPTFTIAGADDDG